MIIFYRKFFVPWIDINKNFCLVGIGVGGLLRGGGGWVWGGGLRGGGRARNHNLLSEETNAVNFSAKSFQATFQSGLVFPLSPKLKKEFLHWKKGLSLHWKKSLWKNMQAFFSDKIWYLKTVQFVSPLWKCLIERNLFALTTQFCHILTSILKSKSKVKNAEICLKNLKFCLRSQQ